MANARGSNEIAISTHLITYTNENKTITLGTEFYIINKNAKKTNYF